VEAEGSRACDRRCSAPEIATNALPMIAGLAEAQSPPPLVLGLTLTRRLHGASSPVAAGSQRCETQLDMHLGWPWLRVCGKTRK
jgi:hypothetical protein